MIAEIAVSMGIFAVGVAAGYRAYEHQRCDASTVVALGNGRRSEHKPLRCRRPIAHPGLHEASDWRWTP